MSTSETTPLLGAGTITTIELPSKTWRHAVFAFLEAKTRGGSMYERFTIFLIVLNVLAFIIGSLFIEEYNNKDNDAMWASHQEGICGKVCDGLFFGNYDDNILEFLNLGSTSVLEIVTVAVFSVDYLFRVYLADLENPKFAGFAGRLLYLPTFYSLVDLASTVPFYVDSFLLRDSNLAASQVSPHSRTYFLRSSVDFCHEEPAFPNIFAIMSFANDCGNTFATIVLTYVPSLPYDAR